MAKELYRIVIREHSKYVVEVEAESEKQAIEQVEKEYWKDPSCYCLEPYDTFFKVE